MRLRPYHPTDEAELVDVWFESWRSTDPDAGAVSRADLAARAARELGGRWTTTVAIDEARLAGLLAVSVAEGRLDQLFIHPEFQGRGIGFALFNIAMSQLPAGFWLSAEALNFRARAFYERQGMVLDRTEGQRVFYVSSVQPPV